MSEAEFTWQLPSNEKPNPREVLAPLDAIRGMEVRAYNPGTKVKHERVRGTDYEYCFDRDEYENLPWADGGRCTVHGVFLHDMSGCYVIITFHDPNINFEAYYRYGGRYAIDEKATDEEQWRGILPNKQPFVVVDFCSLREVDE